MSSPSATDLPRPVLAALVGLCVTLTVTLASAQGAAHARHGARRSVAPPVIVAPVVQWYYIPPPLPYDFYYQQELAKRWPPRPQPAQSFDGSSPRCPRFFCSE